MNRKMRRGALAESERDSLDQILAGMPNRTTRPSNGRPSDLVNLMFVGTKRTDPGGVPGGWMVGSGAVQHAFAA